MGFIDQIRIFDVLDIMLVAVLIYAAYGLFNRTRAARALIGLIAVGVLYLVSRQFDLRLTLTILQAFFAVIIIAMIVIFQDELRHLFERIGSRRWLHASGGEGAALSSLEKRIQIIVKTAYDLAAKRIGALIVIEGQEDVIPHLNGGIVLDGRLSESILKSVFDPHSQGHDGAVLLSGNKVKRFACHLPLSTNLAGTAEYGTRHAAGLGMSERSDALIIIVSEERGVVSVAREGEMAVPEGPTALSGTLRGYYDLVESQPRSNWRRSLFTSNILPKLASLVLAVLLWTVLVFLPSQK